ncbi:MAG: hypothetical protein IT463_07605 [Planctomycetes bacterium]|nr:hypothetical protein [Planctomycetota bacterium]
MSDAEAPPEPKLPLTVDSPIAWAELLVDNDELQRFYKAKGVHCFFCCAAEAETFAQGARVHAGGPHGAFDAGKLVAELNELGRKHPFREETAYDPSLWARLLGWLFPADSKA